MNDLIGGGAIAATMLAVILLSFSRPRSTARRCIRCGRPAAHGVYCVNCLVSD